MQESLGNYKGTDLYLTVNRYSKNNRIYLGLVTDEEGYVDITINLPEIGVGESYAYLSNDIDEELKDFLVDKKVISDTLVIMPYNYGNYRMVRWNKDVVKEYDPLGYASYEKALKKSKEMCYT